MSAVDDAIHGRRRASFEPVPAVNVLEVLDAEMADQAFMARSGSTHMTIRRDVAHLAAMKEARTAVEDLIIYAERCVNGVGDLSDLRVVLARVRGEA